MPIHKILSESLKSVAIIIEKTYNQPTISFPIEHLPLQILERTQSVLNSLNLIWNDSVQDKHFQTIGLMCRNLLTDYITFGYIRKVSKDEDDYLTKMYWIFLHDVKKTEAFINDKISAKFVTDEFIKLYNLSDSDKKAIELINSERTQELLKTQPSISYFIKELKKISSPDKEVEYLIHGYDLWLYLSKHEHIGYYSYIITRNHLENHKRENRYRIFRVLYHTCYSILMCYSALDEIEEKKRFVNIMNELFSNEVDKS